MRLNFRRVILSLAVLASLSACTFLPVEQPVTPTPQPVTSTVTPAPKGPDLTPTATRFDMAACEERLSWVILRYESDLFSHDSLNDAYRLVTYEVANNQLTDPEFGFAPNELISYQDDAARHEKIWGFASSMMPVSKLAQVDRYLVYTDGEGDSLGSVSILDTTSWILAVDIRDAENIDSLSLTLVHEIAHLISLNNDQVVINRNLLLNPDEELYQRAKDDCDTYFAYSGCAKPNSYLNTFFQQFWPDVYAEWQEGTDSADTWPEYYNFLDDFYTDHQDQFVSNYSVTNPMEDLAESFTHFVFTSRPDGNSIAEQKILFFYDYPELVEQRQAMLKTLCKHIP